MKLLAIDPGSNKCGLAFFQDGILKDTTTLKTTEDSPLKRRIAITRSVSAAIGIEKPNLITSEEPLLLGRNNNGMQRLLGMFENITEGDINFIHPMTVKAAMGSGTLDKLEVALAAGEKLQTEAEKEIMADIISRESWDESDAVAVGLTYLGKLN